MGEAVGVIMDPVLSLVGQENFHLILLVMAIITALYASLIQKYTIDWELMRNTQERMKVFQKEFREAQLSQNTYMLKKLEDQRNEMMEDPDEDVKAAVQANGLHQYYLPASLHVGLLFHKRARECHHGISFLGANSCLRLRFLVPSSTGSTGTSSPLSGSASLSGRALISVGSDADHRERASRKRDNNPLKAPVRVL